MSFEYSDSCLRSLSFSFRVGDHTHAMTYMIAGGTLYNVRAYAEGKLSLRQMLTLILFTLDGDDPLGAF